MPPAHEPPPLILLFDRKRPSLHPDLALGRASTVLPCLDALHHDGVPRGYCPLFSLDHWWEVPFLRRRRVNEFRELALAELRAIRGVLEAAVRYALDL